MATKTLLPISSIAQDRFWRKVQKAGADDCWLWSGTLSDKGYGMCYPYGAKGGQFRAHRVSVFLSRGEDLGESGGMHSCDVRSCCNPSHVSAGSQADNLADMRMKGREYKFPVISGERAPHAKLTDAQVVEMRRLAGTKDGGGYWSERRLAEHFTIARAQVHRILAGQSRAASAPALCT